MNAMRKNRKRASTAFESLETRQLLTASLNAGILTITGSNNPDITSVTKSGIYYNVNEGVQPPKQFLIAAVGEIVANMNGGNDRLTIAGDITIATSLSGGDGNDTIRGGGGKDSIFGNDGDDKLDGSLNDDLLNGNADKDNLIGGPGKDALFGGSENDTMDGGTKNDYFNGEGGSDTVTYATRVNKVTAHLDTDYANFVKQVSGGGGEAGESDTYYLVEKLVGGSAGDVLSYNAKSFPANKNFTLPITLDGAGGDDDISVNSSIGGGGAPNDFKYTVVTEIGGKGNDKLHHDHAVSTKMVGGDGDDTVDSIFDDDSTPPISYDGGSGHDTWLDGSRASSYTLDMSQSVEDLFAENSGSGHVTIKGNNSGNEITVSGDTNAKFNIDAKGGNDTIKLLDNFDGDTLSATTVLGGSGNDSITDATSGVTNTCKDKFDGGSGNDTLHGGKGNDSLTGGSGHDKLFGESGNDTLIGNDGEKDTLDGGSGNNDKAKKDGIDNVLNVESFI